MIFGFSLPRWFYGPFGITLTAFDVRMGEIHWTVNTKIKCIHGASRDAASQRVEALQTTENTFFRHFSWVFIGLTIRLFLRLSHWPCNYFFLIASDLLICVCVRGPWTECAHFTSCLMAMAVQRANKRMKKKTTRKSGWSVRAFSQLFNYHLDERFQSFQLSLRLLCW